MASFVIIYGTTGGNTEMAVDRVAGILDQQGHSVTTKHVQESRPDDMKKYDVAILASPTYGHGVLQEYMIPFWQSLKAFDLKKQKCAVMGIGDPKYDAQYHIESAAILEEAIKNANGKLVLPALKISGTPVRHLEKLIPFWTQKLIEAVKKSSFV